MTFDYLFIYAAIFVTASGQLFLKLGTRSVTKKIIFIHLNLWMALGFGCMVIAVVFNIRGLRAVPLRDMAFILPTIYIIIPLLSYLFLGERFGRKYLIGTLLIIVGSIVFNIPILKIV